MDEFEDVTSKEKEFMKMWNRFVHRHAILADFQVAGERARESERGRAEGGGREGGRERVGRFITLGMLCRSPWPARHLHATSGASCAERACETSCSSTCSRCGISTSLTNLRPVMRGRGRGRGRTQKRERESRTPRQQLRLQGSPVQQPYSTRYFRPRYR